MTIDLTKNERVASRLSPEEQEHCVMLFERSDLVEWDFVACAWQKPQRAPSFAGLRLYRQRPTPPLIVDPDLWRHLPKWANCIVGQSNGVVYHCSGDPEKHSELLYWNIKGASGRLTGFQSITFTDPERWEEAIVKRPEGV